MLPLRGVTPRRQGGSVDDVELPAEGRDRLWQRVQLAQSLCADAHLYGGHACLSCQQAARRLLDGVSDDGTRRWPTPGRMQRPPHGISLKASQSQWELLLSTLRDDVGQIG